MRKKLRIILICLLCLGLYLGFSYLLRNGKLNFLEELLTTQVSEEAISEDGSYTSKEEVAMYIVTYGRLPQNFVSKNEAKKLGWIASEGNLQDVCTGCSIGGDQFANREGKLPKKKNRQYYECDIDYDGGTRNGKRLIYSNDGLIYYTGDHYNTFELLYGEP